MIDFTLETFGAFDILVNNAGIMDDMAVAGGFATEISTSMGMPNMDAYAKLQPNLATSPAPGDPNEIAKACLYLASDDATFVSGANSLSTAAGALHKEDHSFKKRGLSKT